MTTHRLPRREFLSAAAALTLGGCAGWNFRPPEKGPVAAMFPGRIDDGGFMESGWRGLERVRDALGIPIEYVADVPREGEAMLTALRKLADSRATLVIAHGDEASLAVQRVAWEFPKQRFACVQGALTRPNLAVYEVQQEQSSWLAGAAAGLLTRTNVVGHLGGARTAPDLKARAAFADGLKATNASAKLLTTFSGSPDDSIPNKRVALAQIAAGADILYATLRAGRSGAIEACRERGVKQIGHMQDWVAAVPDVFVASAFADMGMGVFGAGRDLYDNLFKGDIVKRMGLNKPDAVRLILAPGVTEAVRQRTAELRGEIIAGRIVIPERYSGPEFGPA